MYCSSKNKNSCNKTIDNIICDFSFLFYALDLPFKV